MEVDKALKTFQYIKDNAATNYGLKMAMGLNQ